MLTQDTKNKPDTRRLTENIPTHKHLILFFLPKNYCEVKLCPIPSTFIII